MGLREKLALRILLLIAAIALVAGAGVVGLIGLRARFESAAQDQARLRTLYDIGHRAALVRQMLLSAPRDGRDIERQVGAAVEECRELIETAPDSSSHAASDRKALEGLLGAVESLQRDVASGGGADPARDAGDSLARVATIASAINIRIQEEQNAGARQLAATIGVLVGLSALTVGAAVFIGVRQHRNVMAPITALERASARMRDGDFGVRAAVSGDREFRRLAGRFNEMADELERMYDSMKRQVEAKSRQLVRSEQLASVGQLAAGVAHEINNPLGIIAGYAESAQRAIDRAGSAADVDEQVRGALEIIVEEAFRCRVITESLLSMSRPMRENDTEIDAGEIAERVVSVLGGLPRFAGRRLELEMAREGMEIRADAGELTQVVTNLVANALEAVAAEGGRVRVGLRRKGEWVRLTVEDEGRGISAERLGRVFEPFYTDKPDRGEKGTGLGLAVSHALVQRMGGRIDAMSEGAGKGCTMVVELPSAERARAREALQHA